MSIGEDAANYSPLNDVDNREKVGLVSTKLDNHSKRWITRLVDR
jgi:hypothetical protein